MFLVGVADSKFPSGTSRTKWTNGPAVLPSPLRGDADDLPGLSGWSSADLEALTADTKAHELTEELRLGYVALTRARHLLVVSSYCWSERTTPLGPSPYQQTLRSSLERWGQQPELWRDKPAKSDPNPVAALPTGRPWPMEAHAGEVERRLRAAELVHAAIARQAAAPEGAEAAPADEALDMVEAARVNEWDDELERLLVEARLDRAERRRRTPALEPLRDRAGPAARRPRRFAARPGPADAAPAVALRPLRHPLPRLGRGPVRPAGADRPRRAAGARRRGASTTTTTCAS